MMDSYEVTRALFSRIQNIDPENVSKIMGYILIQDQGEKEMLRLAFGPENLLLAVIGRAKTDLGIMSNSSSAPSTPNSTPSAFSAPISISRPSPLSLPMASPRLANNGFNPSSPSSPSVWQLSGSGNHHPMSPNTSHSLSYAAVVNGTNGTANGSGSGSFSPSITSSQLPFGGAEDFHLLNDPLGVQSKSVDFFDQSLDLAMSPGCRSDSVLYPYWENSNSVDSTAHFHRRSCSVNDVCFGDNSSPAVGSSCKFDAFEQCQQELMRSKVAQQQRLAAAQFMTGMNFPYNKLNFLQSEAQRSAAAALMMGEEFHKLNRCRMGRNDFSVMGGGDSNPGSRQIYLTFPADSTFREEDVSNYFSMYGPVQDVRIPYQQKRMFGFVTFVYPETVKLILAKGNPHFVCDSRVLVKPYKEKGKLPEKKQQQQLERAEFSSCSSAAGLDCREPYDVQLGARMLYNSQEMWRKKMEQQADLQQALEFQGRRLMNLQLVDLKNHHHQHLQNNMPVGSPIPSPNHRNVPTNGFGQDIVSEENKDRPSAAPESHLADEVNAACIDSKEGNFNRDESDLPESLEHILPENLFSSPTKSAGENRSIFTPSGPSATEVEGVNSTNNDPVMVTTSALNMAPQKSCFLEMPRFSSGHGAIGRNVGPSETQQQYGGINMA